MKSISHYSQPDFYSFTSDSIELVELACGLPRSSKENLHLLDLCCGSGVLGIEAALKLKEISKISFLDMQKEFLPYLRENLEKSELAAISDIKIESVGNAEFNPFQFDYILCNPPYFNMGEGRISPNQQRQKCRTFEVDDLRTILEKSFYWLKEDGYLCLSTRDEGTVNSFLDKYKIVKKKKISETWLICLSRLDIN